VAARYEKLARRGELRRRAEQAKQLLANCKLCPHECGVNRLAGELGRCRTGAQAIVSSVQPHYGEERPLVGRRGSGTIFFANCNLACIFCQNYDISHEGRGVPCSAREIADMMLDLQAVGCHNINFVTPTHVVPQILEALALAADEGLSVPLVYNSGGYDSVETLKLLDGIIDIYMPDAKYADAEIAVRLSSAPNYPEVMKAALKEMHRQVGDLRMDENGIAIQGLLVRHLVLPENLAGTAEIMRFLAEEISPDTYVNVMAQYRPLYRASEYPPVNRYPTREEYEEAVRLALEAGLHRLDER